MVRLAQDCTVRTYSVLTCRRLVGAPVGNCPDGLVPLDPLVQQGLTTQLLGKASQLACGGCDHRGIMERDYDYCALTNQYGRVSESKESHAPDRVL